MTDSDLALMQAVLVGPPDPEIVGAEARIRAAQLAADVAALDEMIAEALLFTGPDGRLGTKAEDLAAHGSGAVRVHEHEPEELRVRRIGADVAVSALRARLAVEVGGALIRGTYRYTRVWAREAGAPWCVVGGHVSAVASDDASGRSEHHLPSAPAAEPGAAVHVSNLLIHSPMRPFSPRPISFQGTRRHGDWRLKHYRITAGAQVDDWSDFASGDALAFGELPEPARTPDRPGVGFLIHHRGAGADYIVLGWWDRENELPVRVVVREHARTGAWRPAAASESFCVWDLQVIAFERDAYVATVLAEGDAAAVDAYLARGLTVGGPEACTARPAAGEATRGG